MASHKAMIRHGKVHVREALQLVKETEKYFVTTAPAQKRMEEERCALIDVLFDAHVVLSLTGALQQLGRQAATRDTRAGEFNVLENSLRGARTNLSVSQHVLTHSIVTRLGDRAKTHNAHAVFKSVAPPLAPVLPFKRPR